MALLGTCPFTFSGAQASSYVFSNIDDPSGTATFPQGINNAGQIVGYYLIGGYGNAHGFLYANGNFNTLDHGSQTLAEGINSSGQIVGTYNGSPSGFFYSNGTFQNLIAPGQNATFATGINDSGQIVGYTYSGVTHGFVYSAGNYSSLSGPTSGASYAQGINNSGQIVGYYSASDGLHGFLESGGVYTILDDPFAVQGPSGYGTIANGINNKGQVVGYFLGTDNTYHGFLYDHGSYLTIDDPSGSGTYAWGINDKSEITGLYVGNTTRGFLATPAVPELSTWAMMLLGFAAIGYMAYRRKAKPAFMAV